MEALLVVNTEFPQSIHGAHLLTMHLNYRDIHDQPLVYVGLQCQKVN